MKRHGDPRGRRLDPVTTERLLEGGLSVDDTPPHATGVARVLALVGAPPSAAELAGETAAVPSLAVALQDASEPSTPPRRRMGRTRVVEVVAASLLAVVFLFGGLAAANVLPRGAQHIAANILTSVGVSVPDPYHDAGVDPGSGGDPVTRPSGPDATTSSSPGSSSPGSSSPGSSPSGGGATIPAPDPSPTTLAPDPPPAGGAPGDSSGAGNPVVGTPAGTAPGPQDPIAPGNSGSADKSATGRAIADEKSGGKSGGAASGTP